MNPRLSQNVFDIHKSILDGYKEYIDSFINISDNRILEKVVDEFSKGKIIPDPLVQFNPSFENGGTVDDLIGGGVLSKEFANIFYDENGKSWSIYKHQADAIKKGNDGKGFVVTSGTGSGKSLTYISTIFNHLFKMPTKPGIKAIIVYPLNALINSQEAALKTFAQNYTDRTGKELPITFGKYTGQESQKAKESIINNPPDILLTNYMMLELLMVRNTDQALRNSFKENLQFLVFDELHVYKGRQGADVSLLIRRLKASCTNQNITCIGTSATMVSGGTVDDQKATTAKVASSFFDSMFSKDEVITESLTYSTNQSTLLSHQVIRNILNEHIVLNGSHSELTNNALAVWVEQNIAIRIESTHKLRNTPKTLVQIAKELSVFSGVEQKRCTQKIIELLVWAEAVNTQIAQSKRKDSVLPFRIHQFISQTGYVYLTLENLQERFITLDPNPTVIKEGNELPLFQTVFSRISGHEFVCVRKDVSDGNKFVFRDFFSNQNPTNEDDLKVNDGKKITKRVRDLDDYKDGYLVFEHGEPFWDENDIDMFPDSWFADNDELDKLKKMRLPFIVYVDKTGYYSETDNGGTKAWFIPAPLIFDPTAGVVYQDPKQSENSKLISLGSEGRSTSTTILTLNTLLALFTAGKSLKEQKLMSFTDNRQDASLQSGHFNDFIQVVQLRSAIEKAVNNRTQGLGIQELVSEVVDHLKLSESDYARNPAPDPRFPNEENIQALRDYISYRALLDLQRGWRYVLPNLEATALLQIDYKRLDEYVKMEDLWEHIELFDKMTPEERKGACIQILNFFRLSFAMDFDKLRYKNRIQLQESLKDTLDENSLWSLDRTESLEPLTYLSLDGAGKGANERYINSMGAGSKLGRYIKYLYRLKNYSAPKGKDFKSYVESILSVLHRVNFLRQEIIPTKKGEQVCYQLIVNTILWKGGDKVNVLPDLTSITPTQELNLSTHKYFQRLYQFDFTTLPKKYKSAEHTGQIDNEAKQKREEEFSEGRLSALYCSPTMELGIDISSLNIVHMRNVPPSPANYAQRSGRAGRSGQSALIFTYASNVSPHDRHFYKNQIQMVSGEVQSPRIDLTNEELIRCHLHATILSYLNAEEFKPSLVDLIDMSGGTYRLKETIKEKYQLVIDANFNEIKSVFLKVIGNIDLAQTKWYNNKWLEINIRGFVASLASSLLRWRKMYLDALNQQRAAQQIIDNPIIKDPKDKKDAGYSRYRAEKRKELLENISTDGKNNTLSEFYTFRYLASEGFLPGYNFTRLPLRVFLGGKERNEYISRPRFIALKEFAPNNLIYHNGGKYRINRISLSDSLDLKKMTVFSETGYAYMGDEIKGVNQDPINGNQMKADSIVTFNNLIEMDEVQSESTERISCMEEIRASEGYVVETYVNTIDALEEATKVNLLVDEQVLMKLFYAPSANITLINKKWKKSNQEGFWIGEKTGFFKRQKEVDNPNLNDNPTNITLYTQDTSDILYIQPIKSLGIGSSATVTLQYAIEKAIEKVYNIEAVEIDSKLMGLSECPNIMLYESAEGSLGVLKDLANNPNKLKDIFLKAYEICGYDWVTKEDKYPDKPKASYDDLLSYFNQIDHGKIDRHSIVKALEMLIAATPDNTTGVSFIEKYKELKAGIHPQSPGEEQLLDYLYHEGYKLPDHTNYNMDEYYIQPDFVYKAARALIFVDGGVHKDKKVAAKDTKQRKILENAGFDVLIWKYLEEPIEDFILRNKHLFRKVR